MRQAVETTVDDYVPKREPARVQQCCGVCRSARFEHRERKPRADARRDHRRPRGSARALFRDDVRSADQPRRCMHAALGVRREPRLRRTVGSEVRGCTTRDLGTKWIDTIDLGPSGDVWVGTAISGAPNEVFVSRDDGASFAPVGLQSPKIFWKSVRVAPSDAARVYASGYAVAPPTAHLESSRDGGRSWSASRLAGVALGPTPIVLVAAVDPHAAETFYLVSVGANPPAGD